MHHRIKILVRHLLIGHLVLFFLLTSKSLVAQKKPNLTAYTILNTECPISQQIIPTINDLEKNYGDIKFIAVFTTWDTQGQINTFKKKYKLTTAIIHDKKHKLINSLSASITPEVFLLNKSKQIIYKGAISDQFIALGKRKKSGVTCYLEEAIKDYQNNKTVKVTSLTAVGCKIEPLNIP